MAYTIYKEIGSLANAIPCPHTRRAILKIADGLNDGTFENKIQDTTLTSSAAELNKLDGVSLTATEMDQRALTVKIENVSAAKAETSRLFTR